MENGDPVLEKMTFTFRLGPCLKQVKLVFHRPNPFKMAPSALSSSTKKKTKNVSFANVILLNYIADQVGDDPEWFTKCGDQFQSMSLSKIHGLTESFTLEGRELWGKLNLSADSTDVEKKFEWSEKLRAKITELNRFDLATHVRVSDEKKRADLKIAIEQTALRLQEIRQAEQLAEIKALEERANMEKESKTRRAVVEKRSRQGVRPAKKSPKADGLRLK
jgi:hypothetical protein